MANHTEYTRRGAFSHSFEKKLFSFKKRGSLVTIPIRSSSRAIEILLTVYAHQSSRTSRKDNFRMKYLIFMYVLDINPHRKYCKINRMSNDLNRILSQYVVMFLFCHWLFVTFICCILSTTCVH